MSINSMTNAALARRPDFLPYGTVPRGYGEIAATSLSARSEVVDSLIPLRRTGSTRPFMGMVPSAPAGPSTDDSPMRAQPSSTVASTSTASVNTALNVLFGYIPTEVLTLYVAVIAAINSKDSATSSVTAAAWPVFWAFLVTTPLVVWVVYAAKLKGAGKPLSLQLPIWEMIAATIAFGAWAFALPKSPFSELSWQSGAAPIVVLVTSTVLGLLAPLFQSATA
jgi:hypothetical protein